MAANKTSRPKHNPQDMLVGLDNIVKKNEAPVINETPIEVKNVIDEPSFVPEERPVYQTETEVKRSPGRPRKFKKGEKTEVIGVRLLEHEVRFLEEYGGKFGGKTGYVTYLIRQEMERKGVDML